jgi:hypothetical protein
MGTVKVDPKKDVCHSTLVIEIMMQHFFLEIKQKIPPEATVAGVQEGSTSRVNTLELKERLQQTKCPLTSSNISPRHMETKYQRSTQDSKEEEKQERHLMFKSKKHM